jgi:hypothetical protein
LCCLFFFFWPLCCLFFFFWPLCCLFIFIYMFVSRVRRYQSGNQNPYIEEQTTQWKSVINVAIMTILNRSTETESS